MSEHRRNAWTSHPDAWIDVIDRGLDPFRRLLLDPFLESLLSRYAAGRALDLGCGEGSASRALARRGWAVTAIDIEPAFLRAARDREPKARHVRASAMHLPFGPDSFDFALSKLTSVSLADYGALAHEVTRVLRPGGRFVDVIAHPCFATFQGSRAAPNDYLADAPHGLEFLFPGGEHLGQVTNHHRPLHAYVTSFRDAGLSLDELHEPAVPAELVASSTWDRAGFRGPPFAVLVGRKVGRGAGS